MTVTLTSTLVEKGFEPITPKTTLPAIFRKVYAPTFTVVIIVEVNGGRHEVWVRNGSSEVGVGDISYNDMSERNVLDWLNVVEQAYWAGDLYGSTAQSISTKPGEKPKTRGKWGGYEDWIPWKGGECPVGAEVETQVVFREEASGRWKWSADSTQAAGWRWDHENSEFDVVAYRIVSAEPKPAVESKPILTSESVWRSCADDQPPIHQMVILVNAHAVIQTGYRGLKAGGYYSKGVSEILPTPTHWMPLPPLPE